MVFIQNADFSLHPEGLFRARLIDLVGVPSRRSDWRPQFKCTFLTEATTPGGKQMQVIHYVTQFLSNLRKFGQMVSALGVDLDQIPVNLFHTTLNLLSTHLHTDHYHNNSLDHLYNRLNNRKRIMH